MIKAQLPRTRGPISIHLRSAVFFGLVAAGGLLSANCSVVLNSTAAQCSTDADCASRGDSFRGMRCRQETSTCVRREEYCETNAECVSRFGGQDYICKKDIHECKALLSRYCTTVFAEPGDVANDDAVFIASMNFPGSNPAFKGAEQSIQLARLELKSVNFLPGATPTAPRRPLVIISCDVPVPPTDPQLLETVNHLVDDVGVLGINGPIANEWVATSISVTIPKKTPLISGGSSSNTLDSVPNRTDLLYRTAQTDIQQAGLGVQVIEKYLEPKLRTGDTPLVPAATPLRVAAVGDATVDGTSVKKTWFEKVRFNGKSAAENAAAGNYREFNIGDPGAADYQTRLAQAVAGLVSDFKPHIILLGRDESGKVGTLTEGSWPSGQMRPLWLAAAGAQTGFIANMARTDPTIVNRWGFIQDAPAFDETNFAQYDLRYQGQFGKDPSAITTDLSAAAYDITYLYFYAIASLRDQAVTPEAVGRAIRAVTDPTGTPILAGVDSANAALGVLGQGGKIRFQGVKNTPTFNAQGDNTDGYVFINCVDPTSPRAFGPSGLRITKEGAVVGTSRCL